MQHIAVVFLQIHNAQVRTKRFSVLCKELRNSVVGLTLRNCKIRIKNLVMKCCPYIVYYIQRVIYCTERE